MKELELIEQIHQEFDTAQDRLLDEAKKILSGISVEAHVIETTKRLKLFGFINTPIVKKGDEMIQKAEMSKKEAELIEYYSKNYPFLKFLTEAELDRICTKYGLMYAPVSRYQKDVPIKNIEEIERAQPLESRDELDNIKWIKIDEFWDGNKELKTWLKGKGGKIPYKGKRSRGQDPAESMVHQAILDMGYQGGFGRWIFKTATIHEEQREGLFIAAPKSHFDLKGLIKNGLGFFSIKKTQIKDPIVFRYVQGGVQVITKWGLEAEDPSLVLPINN